MLIFPEHEGCKPQIKKDGKPTAEGEEKTAGREDPELAEVSGAKRGGRWRLMPSPAATCARRSERGRQMYNRHPVSYVAEGDTGQSVSTSH